MASAYIVNPKVRRKPRTAAQKAATRRLVAANKSSKAQKRRSVRAASASPSRALRRYRRNPIKMRGILDQVKDAGIGAAGAFAVEFAISKMPLPLTLMEGQFAPVVRAGLGIAAGMVVSKILKKPALGKAVAHGALTIQLYNLIKTNVGPRLGLSGYADGGLLGYADGGLLGYQGLGYQDIVTGGGGGYQNPAPVFPQPIGFDGNDSMNGF